MPSTIPYDPSLVLGSIVKKETLAAIGDIATAQAAPDAAQGKLNALLSLKRSLEMTKTELLQMGIDKNNSSMKKLDDELTKLDGDIPEVAAAYCQAKIDTLKIIAK